jgi:hypothetical protein
MNDRNTPLTVFGVVITALILCAGFFYAGFSFNDYQARQSAGSNLSLGTSVNPGKGIYVLHDPTYKEMKDFLEADPSDKTKYEDNSHTCTDYTTEVDNNADKLGIRCASVYIIYGETGHSIVAFNTTDRGIIFVEPQFDKEVKLSIGKSYAKENSFVKQDNLDDTIVRYLIMW